MLLSTRGIVFRSIRYGETSVIADIFTEQAGLLGFIAGGVRKARSRMPFGLFQPMTVVDMVAYVKPDAQGLNRVKEMQASVVYTRIPFDLRRGAVALFMAEVCRKCVQEGGENPELFAFLLDCLEALDSREDGAIFNLHLHFLVHLSAYLGFQPLPPDDGDDAYFDLAEGVFLSAAPHHTAYMKGKEVVWMKALMETSPANCQEIQMEQSGRRQLLQQLLQFYRLHVPGFGGINTVEILDSVMG